MLDGLGKIRKLDSIEVKSFEYSLRLLGQREIKKGIVGKRGFFERLSGSIRAEELEDDEVEQDEPRHKMIRNEKSEDKNGSGWMEEENEEAELTVDGYQN